MPVVKYALSVCASSLLLLTGCRHINKHFGTEPYRPLELTYCGKNAVEVGKRIYISDLTLPLYFPDGNTNILDENGNVKTTLDVRFLVNHARRIAQANAEQKKVVRDDIINEVSNDIRESSREYTGAVYQHRAGFDTLSDATLLGLTAAIAVGGGAEVKAALGAAATGITGLRTSVQKNFFDDRSREAIFLVIAANQEKAEKALTDGKKASFLAYSLSDACNDLDRLYESGTVLKALNTIAGQNSTTDKNGQTTITNSGVAGAPAFSPAPGNLAGSTKISIASSTAGATIYYTEDGTPPSNISKRYTEPLSVSSAETIRAFAVASGLTDSSINSAAYTVGKPAAGAPVFSPVQGEYSGRQAVTLTATTSGAVIYYTLDGTRPDEHSAAYSKPIDVAADATIKAIVISPDYSTSAVAAATYTIK